MHGLLEMAFVGEIVLQTKIAKKAAERLELANDNLDNIEVWGAIQSILVATGNVSKILWPTAKANQKRGEMLRQILGVKIDSLLSERTFRNHFEHYDSRIEEYFNKQGNSGIHYTDLAMNPSLSEYLIGLQFGSEFASQFGSQLDNIHRGYNSFNNTLIYWGKILDLNLLIDALDDIHEGCKRYGYS
jgi:hypothetical protein